MSKGESMRIRMRCWKYLSREERRTNCGEEEQEGIAPSIKECGNYLVMSCSLKKVTGANLSSFGLRRPIRKPIGKLSIPVTSCKTSN